MKFFALLITISLITFSTLFAQWNTQNPVPDGNTLRSVFFVDNNNGWIVGSSGFITKTTNSGVDWIQQNSGTSEYIKCIRFVNEFIGWAVGENGLILKSTDGGSSWNNQVSNTNEILNSVNFVDENNGIVVGYDGIILKTIDGGENWVLTDLPNINEPLFSVDFIDSNNGWAVGGNPCTPGFSSIILKTTDAGINWTSINTINQNALYDIDFLDHLNGYAVGIENIILKTTDGGETWTDLSSFYLQRKSGLQKKTDNYIDGIGGLRTVFFKDINHGWVAGGENEYDKKLYYTTDGGSTWALQYYGLEEWDFCSLFVTESGMGWAVGDGGSIFISTDNGLSWARQFSGSGCCNADDVLSTYFVNENIGWAVGKRNDWIEGNGLILKTSDSGKTWITKYTAYCESLIDVYFVDELHGWAIGDNVLITTDGGLNWIENSQGLENTKSIYFVDESTGFISCTGYPDKGIYKSYDGGLTWESKYSDHSIKSVFFIGSNTGWASGFNGLIVKTTDGGETWTEKQSNVNILLNIIVFYNEVIGVCIGENGKILISSDGGESWENRSSGTTEELKSASFTSSNFLWVAGNNGVILNSTDQGLSWTENPGITNNTINSICFVNEYTGWIGGQNGTIFKYYEHPLPVELTSFSAKSNGNTVELNWITSTETNNNGFYVERLNRNNESSNWESITFVPGKGTSTISNEYSFSDNLYNNIASGKISYRLKQVDYSGEFIYSNVIEVELIPSDFNLNQNYPNPFNPSTKIKYTIPSVLFVRLTVFDILGNEVATLVNGEQQAGNHEIEFNPSSLIKQIASGIYFYSLQAGNFSETRKMIMLK